MDLKSFSKDDFECKNWINNFLSGVLADSSTEKDAIHTVSAAVMKLQASFHDNDAEIRQVTEDIPLLLPRTLQDLELLSKDLVLLKDQMATVGKDVRLAEKQSTEAMNVLFTLEAIKQRMLSTEKALKETDNWMTLTSDVEELCNAGDSDKLSDRLMKLHKCFALLAPGLSSEAVAERRNILSSLADRYEAIVSPVLVKAFNDLDRDVLSKYSEVFLTIGRSEQLQSYYWRSRVDKYCNHWESLLARHAAAKFCYVLSEFYVDLTRSWQQEVQWCSLLFDKPAVLCCRVLVELFKKLVPTFDSMLSAKLSPDAEDAISYLLEFKDACDNFTESVTTSGYLPSHSELPKQLFKLVYQPLWGSYTKFQEFFEKDLRRTLDNTILDHVELGECVQLLVRSEERIFEKSHSVKESGDRLFDGMSAPVIIPAFDAFMIEYFGEVKRVAVNLRERVFSKLNQNDGLSSDHWSVVNHCIQIAVVVGSCWQELDEQAVEFCSDISSFAPVFLSTHDSHQGSVSSDKSGDVALSLFVENLMQECPRFRQLYRSFIGTASGEDKVKAVFSRSLSSINALSTVVCTFAFDVLTKPAMSQLKALVSDAEDQSQIHSSVSSDQLPDYSFAPRHQIAELGQYLLTLPHHLDTFGSGNEKKLADALRLCSNSVVAIGKQPQPLHYQRLSSSTSVSDDQQQPYHQQASELLLEPVSRLLTDEIVNLLQSGNYRCGSVGATKQLVTDIDYLLNVFDDLGQMPPSAVKLKQLVGVLRSGSPTGGDSVSADVVKLATQLLPS